MRNRYHIARPVESHRVGDIWVNKPNGCPLCLVGNVALGDERNADEIKSDAMEIVDCMNWVALSGEQQ